MIHLPRRRFISAGTTAGLGTLAGLSACRNRYEDSQPRSLRNHPLDGVRREDIKITDLKVTLLSFELPPKEQWYLDWIP